MNEFPAVLTAPGTSTFTDHDGILISSLDNDAMVALGHHDLNAAHAAFVQHDEWYGVDVADIQVTWATLVEPTEIDGEIPPWQMQWGAAADTPGAFPVMVVEA